MKVKKVPLRKCIACGESKSKKELIRIVKNNKNEVFVDLTGKANGRGAYICSNKECFELAYKTKKIARNLDIEITEEVYDKLKEVIKE
ncbi:YlxR family protein [Tissierella sp. Yu-01]|uniref:RNase P modulator RnpM n=1 Tax=Tissierella sp. Yu-01 TaxID=3035694 RepID=UPI00240E4A57|nr:YlxR family protein [Tissierella sp. Yu-01]WFA09763.1 YlxR family protein [Tissierella sp. Yu-01]